MVKEGLQLASFSKHNGNGAALSKKARASTMEVSSMLNPAPLIIQNLVEASKKKKY